MPHGKKLLSHQKDYYFVSALLGFWTNYHPGDTLLKGLTENILYTVQHSRRVRALGQGQVAQITPTLCTHSPGPTELKRDNMKPNCYPC